MKLCSPIESLALFNKNCIKFKCNLHFAAEMVTADSILGGFVQRFLSFECQKITWRSKNFWLLICFKLVSRFPEEISFSIRFKRAPSPVIENDQIDGRFLVSKPTVHQLSRHSRQPRYTHCTVLLLPHIFFCNSLSTLITYPNLYITGTINALLNQVRLLFWKSHNSTKFFLQFCINFH